MTKYYDKFNVQIVKPQFDAFEFDPDEIRTINQQLQAHVDHFITRINTRMQNQVQALQMQLDLDGHTLEVLVETKDALVNYDKVILASCLNAEFTLKYDDNATGRANEFADIIYAASDEFGIDVKNVTPLIKVNASLRKTLSQQRQQMIEASFYPLDSMPKPARNSNYYAAVIEYPGIDIDSDAWEMADDFKRYFPNESVTLSPITNHLLLIMIQTNSTLNASDLEALKNRYQASFTDGIGEHIGFNTDLSDFVAINDDNFTTVIKKFRDAYVNRQLISVK